VRLGEPLVLEESGDLAHQKLKRKDANSAKGAKKMISYLCVFALNAFQATAFRAAAAFSVSARRYSFGNTFTNFARTFAQSARISRARLLSVCFAWL
jgi:hypothetical protein